MLVPVPMTAARPTMPLRSRRNKRHHPSPFWLCPRITYPRFEDSFKRITSPCALLLLRLVPLLLRLHTWMIILRMVLVVPMAVRIKIVELVGGPRHHHEEENPRPPVLEK